MNKLKNLNLIVKGIFESTDSPLDLKSLYIIYTKTVTQEYVDSHYKNGNFQSVIRGIINQNACNKDQIDITKRYVRVSTGIYKLNKRAA